MFPKVESPFSLAVLGPASSREPAAVTIRDLLNLCSWTISGIGLSSATQKTACEIQSHLGTFRKKCSSKLAAGFLVSTIIACNQRGS